MYNLYLFPLHSGILTGRYVCYVGAVITLLVNMSYLTYKGMTISYLFIDMYLSSLHGSNKETGKFCSYTLNLAD